MLVLLKNYGVKMHFFLGWLFVYMPGSLGPGFTLGEKKKKIGVGKKKFGELSEWGGSLERERPPGHRLAQRYFLFCAFFFHCGAWFQATCQIKMITKQKV